MWTRKELKEKAKPAFKANYWVSVLAAVVIAFFTGGSASSGRNANEQISDKINNGEITTELAVIILAVLGIILAMVVIFSIIKIIVGNAMIVGSKKVFILNEREGGAGAGNIVSVFKSGSLGNVVLVMFLKDLFIGLMTILLVIPGVIFSYRYRMIPYLLAEDPSMKWKEAKEKSVAMMNGQKWKTFVLDLSFIGWALLSACTLGILAIFYVGPYVQQTDAELYLTLSGSQNSEI